MSRLFRLLDLQLLEPGPIARRAAKGIVVTEIPYTKPTRYAVIGGHDVYWKAVTDGVVAAFCEITSDR